jgi:hypothetical protein
LDDVDGLAAVGRGADERQLRRRFDHAAERVEIDGVIVGHHDAEGRRRIFERFGAHRTLSIPYRVEITEKSARVPAEKRSVCGLPADPSPAAGAAIGNGY